MLEESAVLPHTWTERVLAAGTVTALVALVAVAVANWDAFRVAEPVAATSAPVEPLPVATSEPEPPAAAPVPSRAETQPREVVPRNRPAPPPVLTIAAAGGSSWLEVRSGDAGGEQLHFGILEQGDTVTFERLPVWVRIGAVGNVEVRLGAERVRALPDAGGGVAEFVAAEDGVAPPSG